MNGISVVTPECIKSFEAKFEVIQKEKLEEIDEKIKRLREKNDNYRKRINVYRRNEKY